MTRPGPRPRRPPHSADQCRPSRPRGPPREGRCEGTTLFRFATLIAVILCYCTILLGGNVIASDSGLASPDWPSCFGNGNLAPALQGGVALEWSHRVSAFFLATCVLLVAALALAFERHRRVLLRLSLLSLALVRRRGPLGRVGGRVPA